GESFQAGSICVVIDENANRARTARRCSSVHGEAAVKELPFDVASVRRAMERLTIVGFGIEDEHSQHDRFPPRQYSRSSVMPNRAVAMPVHKWRIGAVPAH